MTKNILLIGYLSCTSFLVGCSTISPYDQQAYSNAVSCKVDTLDVMSKSTEAYNSQLTNISALNNELDKAYEYDKGRALNQVTIKMWEVLRNPKGHLLGGYFTDWKRKGKFDNSKYVELKKKQIGQGFDTIIELESGKRKN